MDLQWQRQAERWLQLMGATPQPIACSMKLLVGGGDVFFLDKESDYVRLTLSRPLPVVQLQPTLLRLLNLLHPEACDGIPIRSWLAGHGVWLSLSLPLDSGAEQWAELADRLLRLLNRVMEQTL